ncbi:hypothetical protein DFJ74DRAFT_757670 [Hyaloraphidium curvatum]|nr:hypothetical protein DFJ74DRAFT_757670 [Hyaloraphidium curvatum]
MARALLLAASLAFLAAPALAYHDPFICLVNDARAKAGVAPLGFAPGLQEVAQRVAWDLYNTRTVSHFGSDGSNPLTRLAPLGYAKIGENVAGGQTTIEWAMDSFMGSPGHRKTLLDPAFTCMGSAKVGDRYAQEFGQGGGCPVPDCWRFPARRLARRAVELAEPYVAVVNSTATRASSTSLPEASH